LQVFDIEGRSLAPTHDTMNITSSLAADVYVLSKT